MLPLDLHVWSLPLAFILSQDQTLRCSSVKIIYYLNDQLRRINWRSQNGFASLCIFRYALSFYYINELFYSSIVPRKMLLSPRNGCKYKTLFLTNIMVLNENYFFIEISSKPPQNGYSYRGRDRTEQRSSDSHSLSHWSARPLEKRGFDLFLHW